MESDPHTSHVLTKTDAYRDVPPLIAASGLVINYFVNTEKTLSDDDLWKEIFNESEAAAVKSGDHSTVSKNVLDHAVRQMSENEDFDRIIEILSKKAKSLLDKFDKEYLAISGGERRDWLFSAPVAHKLGVPHISIFKEQKGENKMELYAPSPNSRFTPLSSFVSTSGYGCVHIVDLLTTGSSVHDLEGERETGWVPALRRDGYTINDVLAVVTRVGAEPKLAKRGIRTHSLVAVDEDFLRAHSTNPERTIGVFKDPEGWSLSYVREHGALGLLPTSDPDGKKKLRTDKFYARYADVLKENGHLDSFVEAYSKLYGSKPGIEK